MIAANYQTKGSENEKDFTGSDEDHNPRWNDDDYHGEGREKDGRSQDW